MVFNVLISIFNDLNVNSINVSKDKNLTLISHFINWLSNRKNTDLDTFFAEDEENFDNFCIIMNVFSLLYGKISLTYDSNIAVCLIRFRNLISEDKLECNFLDSNLRSNFD